MPHRTKPHASLLLALSLSCAGSDPRKPDPPLKDEASGVERVQEESPAASAATVAPPPASIDPWDYSGFTDDSGALRGAAQWLIEQIEPEGQWDDLRAKSLIVDDEASGNPSAEFLSASSVRMEDGDVKYNTIRFQVKPDGSFTQVVTQSRGLMLNRSQEELEALEASVTELATFSISRAAAIKKARTVIREENPAMRERPLELTGIEYRYFSRPPEMEVSFAGPGEESGARPAFAVTFDPTGDRTDG